LTANGHAHSAVEDTMFTKDVPFKPEKTFRECLLSRFFLCHLLWLSVMQLRHYLFIGTLNPMLQRLTEGDSSLGNTLTIILILVKNNEFEGLAATLQRQKIFNGS
ncbi:hypothetical protein XENOCAPTIV_027667, partial [Xenoophorus captivus]